MYQIPCADCGAVYVGQTLTTIAARAQEHKSTSVRPRKVFVRDLLSQSTVFPVPTRFLENVPKSWAMSTLGCAENQGSYVYITGCWTVPDNKRGRWMDDQPALQAMFRS